MFEFDGELLVRALRATFQRRATPLPQGLPVALTSTFATDVLKITQWRAFVRKSGVNGGGELAGAVAAIEWGGEDLTKPDYLPSPMVLVGTDNGDEYDLTLLVAKNGVRVVWKRGSFSPPD
jgi:hypothetical protein